MKGWVPDERFAEAVRSSRSLAEVLRKLGRVPAGANYGVLRRRIQEAGLDASHMTGQAWRRALGLR